MNIKIEKIMIEVINNKELSRVAKVFTLIQMLNEDDKKSLYEELSKYYK